MTPKRYAPGDTWTSAEHASNLTEARGRGGTGCGFLIRTRSVIDVGVDVAPGSDPARRRIRPAVEFGAPFAAANPRLRDSRRAAAHPVDIYSCRCIGTMASFSPMLVLFAVLWLGFLVNGVWAVCPHCSGNFPSCTYDNDSNCPSLGQVTANATVIAAGTGVLKLAGLIKPRFLRLFTRVSLDNILALVKRSEPGTAFTITDTTSATSILSAISNGLTTMEAVVFKLCELMEAASEAPAREKIKQRLDCIKMAADIRGKLPSGAFTGLFDTGILTYMWAKVSEFVMKKDMQVKLVADAQRSSEQATSDMAAKIYRPASMEDFSEMLNLFALFNHYLCIVSLAVVADFFEHAVYDTIRARGESWQLAHELMLLMFRRVEDSGGRLSLGKVIDEVYLNTVMAEARTNVQAFFRSPGGNPGRVGKDVDKNNHAVKWNGKFSSKGGVCRFFNGDVEHPASALHPDGTCKFNHVCDHWVKGKGPKGKCLCSAGTPGHSRKHCDNPDACDEPAKQ